MVDRYNPLIEWDDYGISYGGGRGKPYITLAKCDSGNLVKLEDYEQLEAENKRLKECLNDIQSQCVGEISMGYRLDAEDLGRMIYEKTGIKQGLGWKP